MHKPCPVFAVASALDWERRLQVYNQDANLERLNDYLKDRIARAKTFVLAVPGAAGGAHVVYVPVTRKWVKENIGFGYTQCPISHAHCAPGVLALSYTCH